MQSKHEKDSAAAGRKRCISTWFLFMRNRFHRIAFEVWKCYHLRTPDAEKGLIRLVPLLLRRMQKKE